MYYNVEFFFEEPMRLFISQEETEYTIPQEDYEKYSSGKYIKGADGTPKQRNSSGSREVGIEIADTKPMSEVEVFQLTAIKELFDTVRSIDEAVFERE